LLRQHLAVARKLYFFIVSWLPRLYPNVVESCVFKYILLIFNNNYSLQGKLFGQFMMAGADLLAKCYRCRINLIGWGGL